MAPPVLPYPGIGHGIGHAGPTPADGADVVALRHCDWSNHQLNWHRLLDSYEGGERYREATYGTGAYNLPLRNLVRHRREFPDPTTDDAAWVGYGAAAGATDDYELRRSRTPVPEFVAEACSIHLGKLYDQEVKREGPEDLEAWWKDCDGKGTSIDDYMRETVAPLLLVLGCLDVCVDRPPAPDGEEVRTAADEIRLGLDRAVISYILPQNMVWWLLDRRGRYAECLVREYVDPAMRSDFDAGGSLIDPDGHGVQSRLWCRSYVRFRHWTAEGWTLWDYEGSRVLDSDEHPYGMVPIVRLIDLPIHRCPHIGKSRYQEVSDLMRAYYNVDSELTLSNILQAHPSLSGPEEWCQEGGTVPVGPGNVLPMKRLPDGDYQGWEFVSPPKDPADSLRQKLMDIEDRKDRAACLAKPAGAVANSTTAQSGVSKQLDAVTGHKLLTDIARSLRKAEELIAEYALMALHGEPPTPAERVAIEVTYPKKFELFSAGEMVDGLIRLQLAMAQAGDAPAVEREILQEVVRKLLPGRQDAEYVALDAEVEQLMEAKARVREQMREQAPAALGGPDEGQDQAGGEPA